MPELIEAYWPYLLIALAIGIAVGWFIFVANRKTSVTGERRDVLDEGADRAQRNQALIDAPPAAAPSISRNASDIIEFMICSRTPSIGPSTGNCAWMRFQTCVVAGAGSSIINGVGALPTRTISQRKRP